MVLKIKLYFCSKYLFYFICTLFSYANLKIQRKKSYVKNMKDKNDTIFGIKNVVIFVRDIYLRNPNIRLCRPN